MRAGLCSRRKPAAEFLEASAQLGFRGKESANERRDERHVTLVLDAR
jgi:hypothetical protein